MSLDYVRDRITDANVAFIYDSRVNSKRGYGLLRSLPAINYLGVDHFTFPKQWRQLSGTAQYDYLPYTYELLGEIELDGAPLCAITNQYYEDETPFSIRPLLHRFSNREEPLIVIADHRKFNPQEGQRPLHMQPFVDFVRDYRQVYTDFRDQYEEHNMGCPLGDTENLFVQDNANLYEMVAGAALPRMQSLFDILPHAPYLPLYGVFIDIFSREDEPGSAPLDSFKDLRALGSWLRRRVEFNGGEAFDVARDLNRAVDQDEAVFDSVQRERHSTMGRAASVAESVSPETSPVHARYHCWLREVSQ